MINEVLVTCLQHSYEGSKPHSHGPFTLAAAQYYHKGLWGNLRSAWAAVKTWKAAEPGELRAPAPTMAMAVAPGSVPLAALLGMTFHCLLKQREPWSLQEQRHAPLHRRAPQFPHLRHHHSPRPPSRR